MVPPIFAFSSTRTTYFLRMRRGNHFLPPTSSHGAFLSRSFWFLKPPLFSRGLFRREHAGEWSHKDTLARQIPFSPGWHFLQCFCASFTRPRFTPPSAKSSCLPKCWRLHQIFISPSPPRKYSRFQFSYPNFFFFDLFPFLRGGRVSFYPQISVRASVPPNTARVKKNMVPKWPFSPPPLMFFRSLDLASLGSCLTPVRVLKRICVLL